MTEVQNEKQNGASDSFTNKMGGFGDRRLRGGKAICMVAVSG
jgi:hypothetical protein